MLNPFTDHNDDRMCTSDPEAYGKEATGMGYYIQVPKNKDKAKQIVSLHGGRIAPTPPCFEDIAEGEAIICVVDNGHFEAAGFCYNQAELTRFSYFDGRPRTWVIMDRAKACELTGYNDGRKEAHS